MKEIFRRNIAIILILALTIFIAIAMSPYINGIFGALILYVLFMPLFSKLNKKIKNKRIVSIIVITLITLLIIVPLLSLTSALVGEVQVIAVKAQNMIDEFDSLEIIDKYIQNVDLQSLLQSEISNLGSFFQTSLLSALNKVTSFIINLVIAYFLLYYMFINHEKLINIGYEFIPFTKKNSHRLLKEFRDVTRAVVISTGVIALVQGVLLGIGLHIFNVPGATLWGVVGIILSFLPVVGVPIIWIPAGIYKLVVHKPVAATGLFIWGFIISNIDNFLRPALQSKVGKMHPLISLIGIFIGIPFFGILGLVIGPLLLSYFFLTLRMFKEEYMR
ncbi:MAG: AI-2E family transporter [Nanobdellota archaeon]